MALVNLISAFKGFILTDTSSKAECSWQFSADEAHSQAFCVQHPRSFLKERSESCSRILSGDNIQSNRNLMVGKAYTAQLGLQPGDEFEIKLGRKQIKLIPLGSTDDEE